MSDRTPLLHADVPNKQRAAQKSRITNVMGNVDQPLGLLLTRVLEKIIEGTAKEADVTIGGVGGRLRRHRLSGKQVAVDVCRWQRV